MQKKFSTDKNDKNAFKQCQKVRNHCHYTRKFRGAAHNIYNLRHQTPKEIPVLFHNGSTYGYQFIIKHLVKQFDGLSECLEENTEKYITFEYQFKKNLIMVKQLHTN